MKFPGQSVQGCLKKKFAENNTFWAQLLKLFFFNNNKIYIHFISFLVKGKGKVECSSCHIFYQLICYDVISFCMHLIFAIYFICLFSTYFMPLYGCVLLPSYIFISARIITVIIHAVIVFIFRHFFF